MEALLFLQCVVLHNWSMYLCICSSLQIDTILFSSLPFIFIIEKVLLHLPVKLFLEISSFLYYCRHFPSQGHHHFSCILLQCSMLVSLFPILFLSNLSMPCAPEINCHLNMTVVAISPISKHNVSFPVSSHYH
jgi:hypothetical protein